MFSELCLQRLQRGSALVVSMVFMLLLTIIGVGAMQSSSLQERMAGNVRDTNSAFQAAEAAVRAAETYLQGANVGPFTGANGLYRFCGVGVVGAGCNVPDWRDRASGGWASPAANVAGVDAQPQFIIQLMPAMADPNGSLAADEPNPALEFYRVTARGFGASSNSMVVIQTTFRRS